VVFEFSIFPSLSIYFPFIILTWCIDFSEACLIKFYLNWTESSAWSRTPIDWFIDSLVIFGYILSIIICLDWLLSGFILFCATFGAWSQLISTMNWIFTWISGFYAVLMITTLQRGKFLCFYSFLSFGFLMNLSFL